MDSLHIYTDGGARGNPGPGAIGVVAIAYPEGKVIYRGGNFIGVCTNNVAEYKALIKGLRWLEIFLQNNKITSEVIFHSDSQLIVNQVKGFFKVKDSVLRDYFFTVKEVEGRLKKQIKFVLIPREENYIADQIVNKVMDKEIK